MTILETAVFKMRTGKALGLLRTSTTRFGRDDDLERAGKFKIVNYRSRFAGMFSPDLKANTRAG
jgi:hypothetical protein